MRKGTVCLMLAFLIFLSGNALMAMKVQLVEKATFRNALEKPQLVGDFCLANNLYVLLDRQAGLIKIFEKAGKTLDMVSTVGQKSDTFEGLSKPSVSYFDAASNTLVIFDVGNRKTYFFSQAGKSFDKESLELGNWRGAYDLLLQNGRLYVSGTAEVASEGNKTYELSVVDITNNMNAQYFVTPPMKYGLNQEKYDETFKTFLLPLGAKAFVGITDGDIVYYAAEAEYRKMLKIDIFANTISILNTKTPEDTRTVSTASLQELDNLRKSPDVLQYEKKKVQLMPIVRNLFISRNNTIIKIVEGQFAGAGESSYQVQLFNENELKGTALLSGIQPNAKMIYEKTTGRLHILSNDTILIYQIYE